MEPKVSEQLIGIVVIGRNEGERLVRGLTSLQKLQPQAQIVYVDSGSTDNSVAFARNLCINTVELDASQPFSAARARNLGFNTLYTKEPRLEFVQFLDGDCELCPNWIEAAVSYLNSHDGVGIVSGRRSERYTQASIFNQLIDVEWDTPIGKALAVLGDMCVRVESFEQVGGFNENVIAAEDDDFCLRVRGAGYSIHRIDAKMSLHDANVMTLNQWYRRAKRGGHGYANVYHLHRHRPEKYFEKQVKSALFWGAVIPVSFFIGLFFAPIFSVVVLLIYGAFMFRTVCRRIKSGDSIRHSIAYALLIFTGKVPEVFGVFEYCKNCLLSRKHQLIEYK
jgi:GT2 family glycosyltransferase